jgi:hypothetical protein
MHTALDVDDYDDALALFLGNPMARMLCSRTSTETAGFARTKRRERLTDESRQRVPRALPEMRCSLLAAHRER